MKTTSLFLLFILGLTSLAHSQTCSSSRGIDLSQGGPFASLPPRDQGQLGTCYAHASSDLVSSYLNIGRINIYQTAVANDTSMDGGGPADVINSFAKLGWACTDTTLFKNLFPSTSVNIIGELQDTFLGTPIFYTVNANEKSGIERQNRIAQMAADLANASVRPRGFLALQEEGLRNYHALNKQIGNLEDQIEKLEDEKSWFSKNTEINQKIANIRKQIDKLKVRAKAEHSKYAENSARLHGGNRLDSYSEEDAAEIVYYLIQKQHIQFVAIMNKYGLKSMAPSLGEFIKGRVHYDPQKIYSYAGIMYPYKIVKQAMEKACPASAKTKIPANIVGMKMSKAKSGTQALQDKIESLLEKSRQGVGISLHSSLLSGREGENHAVNVIGCRTNGKLTEYLIQNSWGQNCSQYKASLQANCRQGRVWINADSLMSSVYEINWIQKKK